MSPNIVRLVRVCLCAVVVASLWAVVTGQTVPGEKWKQKITVSMDGMTMPMGGMEICAPIGQTEDLLRPDENCTASNVTVVGNTTSATITCTGEDPMTGTVKMTVNGNTVSGRAQMKTRDGDEMVLLMESTKTGPCQAVDVAALAAKAEDQAKAAAAQPQIDVCSGAVEMFANDPGEVGGIAQLFVEPGQPCVTTPANPAFCAALQTRKGFDSLVQIETSGIVVKSASACGLGSVEAVRTKLVSEAENEGDGDFLITHAPDRAAQLAVSECEIKGEMWGGKTPKWDGFCDSNFAAAARGGN